MLIMLATFECLFLAMDYFVYLLEPLWLRLADFLTWKRRPLLEAPRLVTGVVSASRLASELARMWEERAKLARQCRDARGALVRAASDALGQQWPWLKLHRTHTEPTDRQLDWLTHDLGLVADSDWPQLPFDAAQFELEPLAPRLRLIKTDARERLLVVWAATNTNTNSGASGHDGKTGAPLVCRLLSKRQQARDSLRASLLFYYTQLHPELGPLYLAVSRLLSSAGLLEPSVSEIAAASTTGSDQNKQQVLLGRYALALMLVAHLQDTSRRPPSSGWLWRRSSPRLVWLLTNFLASYSTGGRRIVPALSKRAHPVIGMVTEEAGEGGRLVIVDPVELALGGLLDADKQPTRLSDLLARLRTTSDGPEERARANVTSEFLAGSKLGELCSKLHTKLSGQLADGKFDLEEAGCGSLIVTECDQEKVYDCRFVNLDKPAPLAGLKETLGALFEPVVARIRGKAGRKESVSCDEQGKTAPRRRRPSKVAFSWRPNLPWRKLITNLLYLFIFLLVREELFGGLQRWSNKLNEKAREDWIQLKYQLFPHGYPGQEGGGPDEDGPDLSDFITRQRKAAESMGYAYAFELPAVEAAEGSNFTAHHQETMEILIEGSGPPAPLNESEEAETDEPTGGMPIQELLGELMKTIMSESMGGDGDNLDIQSLFGELGLNLSQLREAHRAQAAGGGEDDNDEAAGGGDGDGEAQDKARQWKEAMGKLDLFGIKNMVESLAKRLKTGNVPRPEQEEASSEEPPVESDKRPAKDEL